MRNTIRVVMTIIAIVIAIALVLTLWTTVDASSCQAGDQTKTERAAGIAKAKAAAPIYVEVMSGDVKLNERLRTRITERLKRDFPKAELVDRAARHAPRGSVGLRVTVTSWAPRWSIFYGKVVSSVDAFVRSADGGNHTAKGELNAVCWGIVNQGLLFESDADRIVEWAFREWNLEEVHARD